MSYSNSFEAVVRIPSAILSRVASVQTTRSATTFCRAVWESPDSCASRLIETRSRRRCRRMCRASLETEVATAGGTYAHARPRLQLCVQRQNLCRASHVGTVPPSRGLREGAGSEQQEWTG